MPPVEEEVGSVGELPGVRLVRSARPNEAAIKQLVALEKRLFKKSDSMADDLPQAVTRRNTFTFMAKTEDGELVGYLLCTLSSLVVHVSKVAVAPAARRKGLGRALVLAALRLGKARRAMDATLHVSATNEPALGLYRSLGFEPETELKDYYSPGRDAYFMRAELDQALARAATEA